MKKRFFCIFLCILVLVASFGFSIKESEASCNIELPILMYHCVSNSNKSEYIIPTWQLEEDIKYIIKNGYTAIFLSELVDYVEKDVPLPEKPIILSFDDGGRTDCNIVLPILKKYSIKGVFAVCGAFIDRGYNKDGTICEKYNSSLTYQQIILMQESGLCEFISHSYDMHKCGSRKGVKDKKGEDFLEYKNELEKDLTLLQNKLLEKTGIFINMLAYPYGAYSKDTIKIIKDLGYKAALTCNEGKNYINKSTCLFTLKRYHRSPNRNLALII